MLDASWLSAIVKGRKLNRRKLEATIQKSSAITALNFSADSREIRARRESKKKGRVDSVGIVKAGLEV